MKYTFFSPKTQFENVGDTLINRELIDLCIKNSKLYLDVSRCPDDFKKSLGLSYSENTINTCDKNYFYFFIKIIFMRVIGKECYYFLSPGGYFGEIAGKALISKYINTLVIAFLYFIGVKVCHVGVSYERLGSKNILLLKLREKLLWKHIVRDKITLDYISKLGFSTRLTMPDLAFNIFDNKSDYPKKRNGILFSFRCDQYENQKDEVLKIIKIIDDNFPESEPVCFYSQVERDVKYMKEVASIFSVSSNRKVSFCFIDGDIDRSIEYLSSFNYVVSNRLHVLLMSASAGVNCTPLVSKEYNKKVEGIFSDNIIHSHCNNEEYIIDAIFSPHQLDENNSFDKLEKVFVSIYE
ncbi:polysaccharide pyruvyl transferase family protein [Vibrio lentus]